MLHKAGDGRFAVSFLLAAPSALTVQPVALHASTRMRAWTLQSTPSQQGLGPLHPRPRHGDGPEFSLCREYPPVKET